MTDTVAFVQEWLMSGDHEPTQWDRDFAAAIDARCKVASDAGAGLREAITADVDAALHSALLASSTEVAVPVRVMSEDEARALWYRSDDGSEPVITANIAVAMLRRLGVVRGATTTDATDAALLVDANNWYSAGQIEEMQDRARHLRNEVRRCNQAMESGKADPWWREDRDRFTQELRDLENAMLAASPSGTAGGEDRSRDNFDAAMRYTDGERETVVIPAGMVPWSGAYGPPRDVDHTKPAMRRSGRIAPTPVTGNQWLHVAPHSHDDIIAYTPRAGDVK